MIFDKNSPVMARPLGVRGHQKRNHTIASFKMNAELRLESELEVLTALALDVNPSVQSIVSQPFTVRLDIQKIFVTKKEAMQAHPPLTRDEPKESMQERIYTPDFKVDYGEPVPLVVETKFSEELPTLKTAMDNRAKALNNLGYQFLIVTEIDVGHTSLKGNLVRIRDAMHYRRQNDTRAEMAALSLVIAERLEPFHIWQIRSLVSDLAIYLGLASGLIACDLRQGGLGSDTKIWPAHGDLSHLKLLDLGVHHVY